MQALTRASRLARLSRPLHRTLTTRAVAALDALRTVHKAASDGRDTEYALQLALWGAPLEHTTPAPNEPEAEVEAEAEADEGEGGEAEVEELISGQRVESPVSLVCRSAYPPLAAHGLLHDHMRQNRLLAAAALVLEQLSQGVQFKTRSVEVLLDALCPPPGTLPDFPITPAVQLGPRDVASDSVERLSRDVDLGTAFAVAILNAARENASRRTSDMYRRVFSAIILQKRMSLAAGVYAQLVRDWHLHAWLTGSTPPPVPSEDPYEPEDEPPAKEEEEEHVVVTEAEAMLQEVYSPKDIAAARDMRLDDPDFALPPPKSSHLARIVGHILRPESVDIRQPSKRFTTAPAWEKDTIIAAFLLLELVERRQLDVPDISGVLRVAAAVPRSPTFPMRVYRGGTLTRTKPHAHLESVLRGLMREEFAPRFAGNSTCPPDALRPLSIAAYNELLSFGLERQVPPFELETLVDSMVAQRVEPNKDTFDLLFRRSKLSQNKIIGKLLEKLKVLEEEAAEAQNISR